MLLIRGSKANLYLIFRISPYQSRAPYTVMGGNEDNSNIIFSSFSMKICCDLSLELSHQNGSNDGLQDMFLLRNMDNCPFLSGALLKCML